jgi:putative transposase
MPSYTQNFYHMVFSTRHRVELITPDLETRLHPFLGGILRDLGCTPIAINGMPEHVHLLARYPAHLSHSDMLRDMKSRSSKWIHQTFPELAAFAWQENYGGFTVSTSMVPRVKNYILGQKEHHKTQDYRTEFLALLRKNRVEFDETEVFE